MSGQNPDSVDQEERRVEEIREEKNTKNGGNQVQTKESVLSQITFKPPFDSESFKLEFSKWIEYRMGLKSPKGEWSKFFEDQIDIFSECSADDAISSLKASRCNGWTGLFTDKLKKKTSTAPKNIILRPLIQ